MGFLAQMFELSGLYSLFHDIKKQLAEKTSTAEGNGNRVIVTD
jgi:hypothetical protein